MLAAPEEIWPPCDTLLGTPGCSPGLCQGHLPQCGLLMKLLIEQYSNVIHSKCMCVYGGEATAINFVWLDCYAHLTQWYVVLSYKYTHAAVPNIIDTSVLHVCNVRLCMT